MRLGGTISVKLAVIASLLLSAIPGLSAAELVMLEQDGCHWCEQWHEEIGQVYPKTRESKIAPLRKVNIDNGKEVARLRGYPGDNFFWPLLEDMLRKLPEENEASG